MKGLKEFIQIFEDEQQESAKIRSQLKFVIYREDGKVLDYLNDEEPFQKIVCNYYDDDKGIEIEFLIGRHDGFWKLWAGKPGVVNYSDDPYKDLETKSFTDALNKSVDEAEKFINKVMDEPENWVQFYVNN